METARSRALRTAIVNQALRDYVEASQAGADGNDGDARASQAGAARECELGLDRSRDASNPLDPSVVRRLQSVTYVS